MRKLFLFAFICLPLLLIQPLFMTQQLGYSETTNAAVMETHEDTLSTRSRLTGTGSTGTGSTGAGSTGVGRVDFMSVPRLAKTLVSLVLVCSLAILLIGKFGPRLFGRFPRFDRTQHGQTRKKTKETKRKLGVVDRLMLDSKNKLVVVQVNECQEMLLSISEQGTKVLAIMDAEGAIEVAEERAGQTDTSDTTEKVTSILKRMNESS